MKRLIGNNFVKNAAFFSLLFVLGTGNLMASSGDGTVGGTPFANWHNVNDESTTVEMQNMETGAQLNSIDNAVLDKVSISLADSVLKDAINDLKSDGRICDEDEDKLIIGSPAASDDHEIASSIPSNESNNAQINQPLEVGSAIPTKLTNSGGEALETEVATTIETDSSNVSNENNVNITKSSGNVTPKAELSKDDLAMLASIINDLITQVELGQNIDESDLNKGHFLSRMMHFSMDKVVQLASGLSRVMHYSVCKMANLIWGGLSLVWNIIGSLDNEFKLGEGYFTITTQRGMARLL